MDFWRRVWDSRPVVCILKNSQEIVYGLALIAFSSSHAPLVEGLRQTYPGLSIVFSISLFLAGVAMVGGAFWPRALLSHWVLAAGVTGACFFASMSVESPDSEFLYVVTWLLFFFLALTQSIRHWRWGEDCGR